MTRALAIVLLGLAACLPAHAGGEAAPAERTPVPAAPAADSAACPDPATIVRDLQTRYDTTRDFRADFRQTTTVAALGASEEAHGTVAFKKPGMMRWEYAAPEAQTIVSDGSMLWIHQPAERQVLTAPFRAAFVSTTPISFLTGVGRITDDFRPAADARGCTAKRLHVRLVPKNEQDLGSLTLAVARASADIVEAAITDPIGNVTTLAFADQRRNVDIPDAEFAFVVPPGTDVVRAPGAATP